MSSAREQIKVLIAVSNNILAEGLRIITAEDTRNNAIVLGRESRITKPDILLFDINQKLQTLLRSYPGIKPILIDTGLKDQEIAYLLISYKIRGVISPDANLELFQKALRVVNEGEIWIDQKHLKSLLRGSGVISENGAIHTLSSQDRTIVGLISQGLRNREIGEKLCLSEHTIKAHVSRIFKRLNVNNRAQLVSLAKDYFTNLHQ